ncbi:MULTISPECIES: anti-repressor SinI family protein [Gracilibacillus]|nr:MULTISPECIES: anti-repressor SinI family protein [Gracilibacillus]
MSSNLLFSRDLDAEWAELILEAHKLGITKEEIREFLNKPESFLPLSKK